MPSIVRPLRFSLTADTFATITEFARNCLELGYKVAPESRRVLFEMARIWHQWAQHQEQGAAGREQGAAP